MRLHKGKKFLVGAFYVPPQATAPVLDCALSSVKHALTVSSNHNLLVIGDLITLGIHWDNATFPHYNYCVEQKCSIILDFLAFTSLQQLNRTKNSRGNILDLCFTDIPNMQVLNSDIRHSSR